MQELIQSLAQKTGISPEKASEAVKHVLEFLKSKLPSSLHAHIDSAVGGSGGNATDKISDAVGGMFGK